MKRKLEERFNRILLMVPLILREEGASIDELCEKTRMSKDEIIADLDLLFLCGLPDYGPGDLIDVGIENDRIFLSMADYFNRPLRLTKDEALALLVAGEALIRANVFKEASAIGRAMQKITRVLGEAEKRDMYDVVRRVEVEIESEPGKWWKDVARALEKDRNLVLEYYSFSRDEVTQREVEPVSFVFSHGNWYLYGWCHKAGDWRLFRLDR
ncbi:MAG: WYL domain-containing protein, partial [Actinomycetota bacterium]|nr:WYL domain-containing protein [Actinomycetota bacterium]